MKRKFRTPFIVLTVLAFVFLVAFLGLYVGAFFALLSGADASEVFEVIFNIPSDGFVKTITFQEYMGEKSAIINSIALIVYLVLVVLGVILSIALGKKKASVLVLNLILSLLIAVPALFLCPIFLDTLMGLHLEPDAIVRVLLILVFAFGLLYPIVVVANLFVGKGYAKECSMPVEEAPLAVGDKDFAEPEPVEYEQLDVEPVPVFMPEPEPEAEPKPASEPLDANSLAAVLKDVVREIVRDEIARNNANNPREDKATTDNHSIVGATFAGPLVVQYFGTSPVATPAPAPAPVVEEKKEEPKPEPAPVVEEKKPEPEPEPAPAPVVEEPVPVVEEPAPAPVVEEPAPVVAPVVEEKKEEPKAPIVRISFEERIVEADKDIQDAYNEIKNELLSYGVKSRISSSGDTFRLHRKTYVKVTVAGKSLKLYFALDPENYRESTIPVQDAGGKDTYAEIPLVFKVRSGLSLRRCKQLIQDVMEVDHLEQKEVESVNWVKEIKAELKEKAKAEKAKEQAE